MKRLPDPLYAMLPYMYIVGGFFVMLIIDHPLAVFSGALLILAGLTVFNYRLAHRVKKRDIVAFGRCVIAHTCKERH